MFICLSLSAGAPNAWSFTRMLTLHPVQYLGLCNAQCVCAENALATKVRPLLSTIASDRPIARHCSRWTLCSSHNHTNIRFSVLLSGFPIETCYLPHKIICRLRSLDSFRNGSSFISNDRSLLDRFCKREHFVERLHIWPYHTKWLNTAHYLVNTFLWSWIVNKKIQLYKFNFCTIKFNEKKLKTGLKVFSSWHIWFITYVMMILSSKEMLSQNLKKFKPLWIQKPWN